MTRQERSYLLHSLSEADRTLLAELPRKASLADEIAFLRLRLVHLAADDGTDEALLVRMLALLTRMVGVQSKLGNDSGDTLAEVNELVRQRLAKGATPDEAVADDLPAEAAL